MTNERNLLDECMCQRVRMAARAVTRAYDDALRPTGLRATQLSVLVAVAQENAVSIASLSRLLGMDRSTLTRNLRPLAKEGLVVLGSEGRHRSRNLRITSKGNHRLLSAVPLWDKVQGELRKKMGGPRWAAIRSELDGLGEGAGKLTPAGVGG
jgi:DNA-binding MarR family transcriptional regulator